MNAFIQILIKFFMNLFGGKSSQPDNKPINKPTPAPPPKPKPQPVPVVEVPVQPEPPAPAASGPLPPNQGLEFKGSEEEKVMLVSDGEVEGKFKFTRIKRKKGEWTGWYTSGQSPIKDFIQREGELLKELEMTQSSQNLLQAVSENEGKLEAINAYDGAFLSFGIFQWTLGVRDTVGELPALLKKLKATYPDTFQQYFGRYGLDIADETNTLTGYLTLNGEMVKSNEKKENFRAPEWVYRFWRAGGDREVQAIEIEHALSRLKSFYWSNKVFGFKLNQIITSEYGVALLLDNHVNLPGLMTKALRAAMDETELTDPTNWGTNEERRVLEAYVKHRASGVDGVGPMFDAEGRARRTAAYVANNTISDERGSFRFSKTLSRGVGNYIPEPQGFDPEDYPELEPDIEGRDMEFLSHDEDPAA